MATEERELGTVTASLDAVLKEVGNLSSASKQVMEIFLKISEAVNQHSQSGVLMAGGADIDSRTQLDEVFLSMKHLHNALEQRGTRKHWVVHALVNLGMFDISVANMQSILRKSVRVTSSIANQLRSIS